MYGAWVAYIVYMTLQCGAQKKILQLRFKMVWKCRNYTRLRLEWFRHQGKFTSVMTNSQHHGQDHEVTAIARKTSQDWRFLGWKLLIFHYITNEYEFISEVVYRSFLHLCCSLCRLMHNYIMDGIDISDILTRFGNTKMRKYYKCYLEFGENYFI